MPKIQRFRIKKEIPLEQLKKYGFEEESKRYIYCRSVVKMQVDKRTRLLTFNMPCNTTLAVYTQMVKDDIVELFIGGLERTTYHYVGLDDEEFELIKNRRIKKGFQLLYGDKTE